MTRKIIFLLAFSFIFSVSTIFSQQKTSNFLGTWKLDDASIKPNDRFAPKKPITLRVSETDGKLRIESKTQGYNHAYTEFYQLNEKTEVTVPRSRYGVGVRYRRVRFLRPNKLQLFTTYRSVDTENLNRITWILSGDGKTLTVKNSGSYSSNKLVFTKQ